MAITPGSVTPDNTTPPAATPAPAATAPAQAPASAPAQAQAPAAASAPAQAPAQTTPTPSSPTTQSGMPGMPTADATAVATAHPTSVLRGALMGILGAATKIGKGIEDVGKATGAGQSIVRSIDAHKAAQIAAQGAVAKQGQEAQAAKDAAQKAQDEHIAAGDVHSEQPLRMNILSNQETGLALTNSLTRENLSEAQTANLLKNNAYHARVLQIFRDQGIPFKEDHGPGFDNLGPQTAADVASGKTTLLSNGGTGENHGVIEIDNAMAQKTPLVKDVDVIDGYKVDPKTGHLEEIHKTLQAGHDTVMDVLNSMYTSQADWARLSPIADQLAKEQTTAADIKAKGAEANKSNAEAENQRASAVLNEAYAKQIGGGGGGAVPTAEVAEAVKALPPEVQKTLQQYNPGIQGLLIRGAGGWIDPATFPSRLTKGGIGITRAEAEAVMVAINPKWTDSLYSTIKKTNNDFINGKEGQAIRSFDQFLVHADGLKNISAEFQRSGSPWLNSPLNEVESKGLGDPNVARMMTAIEAARHEWQLFIDSGYAPDEEQNKRAQVLMSDKSSLAQIAGVLGVMGDQAIGRLDQLNESYRTATGIDYPNLVTPSGREAANDLGLGAKLGKYKTGGSYNQGRTSPQNTSQIPAGTKPVVVNGKTVGYTTDGKTMTPIQ